MSLPQNLGRLSAALTSDASLNIGVGVTPSGSFKLEVGTTSKFTGIATFGSTLSNGTYSYTLPSATGILALTSAIPANPVGGTGTINTLPKFTAASTIGDSAITDDGTTVTLVSRALSGTTATFANTTALGIATQTTAGFYNGIAASASGSSFFTKTGSLSSSFSSGFGVDGTYSGGLSVINLRAIGTQQAGGYASAMHFVLDNDGVQRNHALFSSDGSTTLYGALTGTSATFSTSTNGIVTINRGSSSYASLLKISTAGVDNWAIGIPTLSSSTWVLYNYATGTSNLSFLSATGAATFSSSVTINSAGKLTVNRSDNTRYGEFYTDNTAVHLTSSTDPIRITSADRTEFYNAGSERMRITSGGNVGIGTTSPNGPLDVVGPNYGGLYTLSLIDTAAVAANIGGGIYFGGNYTGTTKTGWAGILGRKDNATDGQYGGYMAFETRTHGSAPTERMRITSGGNVLIGTTTDNGNKLHVSGNIILGTTAGSLRIGTNAGDFATFNYSGGGTSVKNDWASTSAFLDLLANSVGFRVSGTGSATLTGTLTQSVSDERFKKNIELITNALEKIKSINGYTFEYDLENKDLTYIPKLGKDIGVLAQEIEQVIPEAVSIAPIDRNEEGKSKSGKNYLTVNYEKIIPLLIQGIKEQQSQIEALKLLIK